MITYVGQSREEYIGHNNNVTRLRTIKCAIDCALFEFVIIVTVASKNVNLKHYDSHKSHIFLHTRPRSSPYRYYTQDYALSQSKYGRTPLIAIAHPQIVASPSSHSILP